MKKFTACVLILVFVSALLVGCGDMNRDGEMDVIETPIISPIITPDVEDGIVDDRDGLIRDNDGTEPTPATDTLIDTSPAPTDDLNRG